MEKPEVKPAVCEVGQGTLPGCAALAFPYIPMQSNNPTRYSRTEALQTGTLFPGLDLPFKAAIQARTKLLKLQSQTVELIKAIPGIGGINAYAELTNGFITVRNIATVICLTLIAVLFVVSMFIISNTIKLTTFDRRDEIAIMKMVGATNGFIRWPFVYEGFMLGLTGAILAFLLQWGLYEAIAQGVADNDTLQLLSIVPFQQLWKPVGGVFLGAGILIGVGGSLSAIRRFLQV